MCITIGAIDSSALSRVQMSNPRQKLYHPTIPTSISSPTAQGDPLCRCPTLVQSTPPPSRHVVLHQRHLTPGTSSTWDPMPTSSVHQCVLLPRHTFRRETPLTRHPIRTSPFHQYLLLLSSLGLVMPWTLASTPFSVTVLVRRTQQCPRTSRPNTSYRLPVQSFLAGMVCTCHCVVQEAARRAMQTPTLAQHPNRAASRG